MAVTLLAAMGISKCRDGRDYFRNSDRKGQMKLDFPINEGVSRTTEIKSALWYSTGGLVFITKTRLLKYIENFTTKNRKFSDKNSDIYRISAQNIDCG